MTATEEETAREKMLRILYRDRVKAHKFLFGHRRKHVSPPFHTTMIVNWHSPTPHLLQMAFRGGAKSTISEEAVMIAAGFKEFRNALIIGASEDMAKQRLASIIYEIEQNERLQLLFGDLVGPVWGADQVVLANNIQITARGRGQTLRGTKFQDARPDLLLVDDLEDRVDVRTPERRAETVRWFYQDLLPALDPDYRARFLATPLHPEALPMILEGDRDWVTEKYPITYIDDEGAEQSSWPDRFPLEKIEKMKGRYLRAGMMQEWSNEYMVTAVNERDRSFKPEMFRVEPQVRTWQASYAMFDPARTTNKQSATTGYACWSWINGKLIVWDGWARQLAPSEIIGELFNTWTNFHPAIIGIEEDGLNEWLMQPIRQEQVKRGITLPVKAMRAPKGKLDFIRGLQPYFTAREVVFAQPLEELKTQFLGFPGSKIDGPNALAYALKMRPGAAVYDDFATVNVAEDLHLIYGKTAWLALNCTPSLVTAALCQVEKGQLRIYLDWVREGDPREVVADIVAEAQAEAQQKPKCVAGPVHFNQFTNFGLRQALARIPRDLSRGAPEADGRDHIRGLLRAGGATPKVIVDPRARWVLNGFAGGFSREIKNGLLADYPTEGPYRTLMEGIEHLAGTYKLGSPDDINDDINLAFDDYGRPYRSILPRRRG